MTKYDEVRKILHESGFEFKDSDRTALDMTDEEVDAFLFAFVSQMTKLAQVMTGTFQKLSETMVQAVKPMQELACLLAEVPEEEYEL